VADVLAKARKLAEDATKAADQVIAAKDAEAVAADNGAPSSLKSYDDSKPTQSSHLQNMYGNKHNNKSHLDKNKTQDIPNTPTNAQNPEGGRNEQHITAMNIMAGVMDEVAMNTHKKRRESKMDEGEMKEDMVAGEAKEGIAVRDSPRPSSSKGKVTLGKSRPSDTNTDTVTDSDLITPSANTDTFGNDKSSKEKAAPTVPPTVPPKFKALDKRSDMIDRRIGPRQVLCYVCCAEFGTSSLAIHRKTCIKKQ
jgi:hypothetical protein